MILSCRLRILFFAAAALPATPILAGPREEVAVIRTAQGEMAFRFFEGEAPRHTAYVKELIRRGFYDGTAFHRVIPHFVIQGGDPNSKDADRSNDGDGEADRRLPAEFSRRLHYRPGTVGMARDADPDSGSCQFFIALENLPRLDGRYTIFGELISGLEVARAIAETPRDLRDNPLPRVEMKVVLEKRKVPAVIQAETAGPDGEVLTGPGKPRPWDPGNVLWQGPALQPPSAGLGTEAWKSIPLDLSLDSGGSVLDVRFGTLEVEHPAEIVAAVRGWRFTPARFQDQSVKARFSIDSHGGEPAVSRVPGTPEEAGKDLPVPVVAVPVSLPEGMKAPEHSPLLRLTIDETGKVSEVYLQASCGDPALDEAAVSAARNLLFTPVLRGKEPVPIHLNVSGRFLGASPR